MKAGAITACFKGIAQQMQDLPFYNPNLEVEVYQWQWLEDTGELGILITPWCLNLLVFPDKKHSLPAFGEAFNLSLPSGVYLLHAARHEHLGGYAYASLSANMLGFSDQWQARDVAKAVMLLLLQQPDTTIGEGLPENPQRRHLFNRLLKASSGLDTGVDAGASRRV